jgi:hypothetical protein
LGFLEAEQESDGAKMKKSGASQQEKSDRDHDQDRCQTATTA